jgi:hypothetical protein
MKFNNETLKEAVKEWLEDATKAEAMYGHISSWDTRIHKNKGCQILDSNKKPLSILSK